MKLKMIFGYLNGLAISTRVLIIEAACSLVGNMLEGSDGWYFVGISMVILVGMWACSKSFEAMGQAIEQMYFWDFVVHAVGLIMFLTASGEWLAIGKIGYKSALASLTVLKILAIVTSGAVPGQSGWPTLIPFAVNRRIVVPAKSHDYQVYLLVASSIIFGLYFGISGKSIDWEMWGVPVLLAVIAERNRARSIKQFSLDAEALEFAGIFASCTPDLRTALKDGLLRAAIKVKSK